MSNINWLSRLAFADESTPGTPPANAAAWASETSIQHIGQSLNPESLWPDQIEDVRSQVHGVGNQLDVEGLRNGEFPYQLYLSGTGTTTTAGTQVAETALSRVIENWCGGIIRTNSTTVIAGGSATAIDATADTNFAEGGCIGWQHPSTGEVHVRRLMENTAGTTWSLDEALPQACAAADVIHGMITLYPDDSIMASSNVSGRQLSYLMQFGLASIDDSETYVCTGCVNNVTAFSWERNSTPTIDVSAMYSDIVLPNESPPTSISWSADPVGVAPAVIGPAGRIFFQNVGTTTQTAICMNSVSFNPGCTRTRTEAVTETSDGMQGTCKFAFSKMEPEVSFVLTPWGTDEMADYAAGTLMQWRTQAGTSAGFVCALGVACASVNRVTRAVQNDTSARMVTLMPHMPELSANNQFTTDTAATRAPWYIAIG